MDEKVLKAELPVVMWAVPIEERDDGCKHGGLVPQHPVQFHASRHLFLDNESAQMMGRHQNCTQPRHYHSHAKILMSQVNVADTQVVAFHVDVDWVSKGEREKQGDDPPVQEI